MPGQIAGHYGQDIVLHTGLFQPAGRLPYPVIGSLSRSVQTETVVAFPAAVQGQARQKAVLFEKAAPLLVQQRSIRLDGIVDRQAGRGGFFYMGGEIPEEIQSRQGGFPSLEQECDRSLGRLHRLFDQSMAHRLRHPAVIGNRAGLCLVGIKAIRAAQIASAGSGL